MRHLFILLCCGSCVFTAGAQSLVIPPDTSYISFPDNARVFVTKKNSGKTATFQLQRKDFKGMVTITNYLLARMNASIKMNELFQRNERLFDSTIAIMERKYEAERERTQEYKAGFEEMKQIASQYHAQLNNCVKDLEVLNRDRARSRKKVFVTGIVLGLAAGVAGTAVIAGGL